MCKLIKSQRCDHVQFMYMSLITATCTIAHDHISATYQRQGTRAQLHLTLSLFHVCRQYCILAFRLPFSLPSFSPLPLLLPSFHPPSLSLSPPPSSLSLSPPSCLFPTASLLGVWSIAAWNYQYFCASFNFNVSMEHSSSPHTPQEWQHYGHLVKCVLFLQYFIVRCFLWLFLCHTKVHYY